MQNNDESTVKNESGPSNGENRLEDIMKSGSVISRSDGETIHCLTIIGQIEGHYLLGDGQKATKYEHILPLLVSIEESEEIDGMLMVLNTMGGDVEADGFPCPRRRTFHRSTARRIGGPVVYRTVRDHDRASRADQRNFLMIFHYSTDS